MPFDMNVIRDTYLRLTFLEASILAETIMKDKTCETTVSKQALFSRIMKLHRSTADATLKAAAGSLLNKLSQLHPDAYAQLCIDATSNKLLFPPNYLLPSNFYAQRQQKNDISEMS